MNWSPFSVTTDHPSFSMSSSIKFFRFKPLDYPSHFSFKDPDTGYLYRANSKKELLSLIVSYRHQNELPQIEALAAVTDHYLCSLPEHNGRCEPNPFVHRGFLQYFKGGVALIQNLLYNKMVTQEKAEERGAVCIECPKNVFPDKKGFVAWSDDIASRSTGGRKSKHHDQLGNCEVCSCPLKAKVFYGGKLVVTDKEMKEFPEPCWIKKEINGRHPKA